MKFISLGLYRGEAKPASYNRTWERSARHISVPALLISDRSLEIECFWTDPAYLWWLAILPSLPAFTLLPAALTWAWSGPVRGEPLSHPPLSRNKSLQGSARLSPGAGQAGCVILLTLDWLSLCSFNPSLFQSVVGDSGRINRAPSRKVLRGVP